MLSGYCTPGAAGGSDTQILTTIPETLNPYPPNPYHSSHDPIGIRLIIMAIITVDRISAPEALEKAQPHQPKSGG